MAPRKQIKEIKIRKLVPPELKEFKKRWRKFRHRQRVKQALAIQDEQKVAEMIQQQQFYLDQKEAMIAAYENLVHIEFREETYTDTRYDSCIEVSIPKILFDSGERCVHDHMLSLFSRREEDSQTREGGGGSIRGLLSNDPFHHFRYPATEDNKALDALDDLTEVTHHSMWTCAENSLYSCETERVNNTSRYKMEQMDWCEL